jgi:hypothetical protein
VAIDRAGRVWITTLGDGGLWTIAAGTSAPRRVLMGLANPQGLTLDRCGDPIVVEQNTARIVRLLLTARAARCPLTRPRLARVGVSFLPRSPHGSGGVPSLRTVIDRAPRRRRRLLMVTRILPSTESPQRHALQLRQQGHGRCRPDDRYPVPRTDQGCDVDVGEQESGAFQALIGYHASLPLMSTL